MHLVLLSFFYLVLSVPFFVNGWPTNPSKETFDEAGGCLAKAQQESVERDHVFHPTIFVLGDLHGDLEATLSLLLASHLIQFNSRVWNVENAGEHLRIYPRFENVLSWAGRDAVLVQMGDIVDRGPDGYLINKLFMYLSEKAREQNGKILHILGNHELMNLQGEVSFVNPVELLRHWGNSLKRWRRAWSTTEVLGKWIRERFSVYTTLNNRFLFVHAGLKPFFSRIPETDLKRCLWDQIDGEPQKTPQDPQGVSSPDVCPWDGAVCTKDFIQKFIGRDGPFWLRDFSLLPQEETCPEIDETLRTVFSSPLKEDPSMKSQTDAERGAVDPKFMLVGHIVTRSGSIEVRCNCRAQENQAYSTPYPSFYIMVDTGISRYVRGTGKILKITEDDETVVMEQISSSGEKSTLLKVPLDNPCGQASAVSRVRFHHGV